VKHFNLGNVWGRVASVEKKTSHGKTPYLAVQVECPNSLYGNIKTYGRLWGEDKINAFFDYHKAHPGSAYRFRGFFSQYDKEEGKRYSNYTFYSWEVFTGGEFRAAFILVGEVTAIETSSSSSREGHTSESPPLRGGVGEGEVKLSLHLIREGQGDHRDIEEDFEVYCLNAQEAAGISEGDIVHVKGVMRYKESEDYFGGSPQGHVKPYVMEIKQKTEEVTA
jgi:hypothetical protein